MAADHYRQDIPASLLREAVLAETVGRSLHPGPETIFERLELADMAMRLRDMASELRRRESQCTAATSSASWSN